VATITAKNLADAALTGSLAAVYTVAASTRAVIKAAVLCNTTGSAISATVAIMARTSGSSRTVISARSIAAGESYRCPELVNQVLEAGGELRGQGNGLTLMASGVEVV
jgi:hypothetical protein